MMPGDHGRLRSAMLGAVPKGNPCWERLGGTSRVLRSWRSRLLFSVVITYLTLVLGHHDHDAFRKCAALDGESVIAEFIKLVFGIVMRDQSVSHRGTRGSHKDCCFN